tara:strand:- start:688 stop:1134 length:447 start_codon:yes stop_codon:yes gene_type:complete
MRKLPKFLQDDLKALTPFIPSFRSALVSINEPPNNSDFLMVVQFRDAFIEIVSELKADDPENLDLITLFNLSENFCKKVLSYMQTFNAVGSYDSFAPIIGKIFTGIVSFFGGGKNDPPPPPPPKDNTALYLIGGGVGLLVLVLVLKVK